MCASNSALKNSDSGIATDGSILIVEDEGIVARDIHDSLESLGYSVAGMTATGEEAITMAQERKPDLVLMDVMLAGAMDGIDAAKKIYEEYHIPVVYLTAYADTETLQRAKVTAPYAFIAKPFEERELHASIEIALYKHRMEKELEEREEQLRQAQKMEAVGRMAGGIAHDFNNMLTSILGFGTLIQDQLQQDDPIRKDVEEILQTVERASRLTKQLLSFSRSTTLPAKPMDANAVILKMTQLLRRTIPETVRIDIDTCSDPAGIKADPTHIHQVIMNIALNAWDAMPAGGQLTIQTRIERLAQTYHGSHSQVPPGEYTVLSVRDTGVGMSESVKAHAFEPFFTTKERGKGTGLGLSTVYGIVHQYNGYVDLKTEPNVGTEITIFLPRVAVPVEQKKPRHRQVMPKGTETVLLVEDEAMVMSLAQRVLKSLGYQILCARHGGEALQVSDQHRGQIHLMLTDLIMPEMGGNQLSQHMAKVRPEMKVLFMSGYTDGTHTRQDQPDVSTPFLEKPFTPLELAQAVRQALDSDD